jgi:hypothetical protein
VCHAAALTSVIRYAVPPSVLSSSVRSSSRSMRPFLGWRPRASQASHTSELCWAGYLGQGEARPSSNAHCSPVGVGHLESALQLGELGAISVVHDVGGGCPGAGADRRARVARVVPVDGRQRRRRGAAGARAAGASGAGLLHGQHISSAGPPELARAALGPGWVARVRGVLALWVRGCVLVSFNASGAAFGEGEMHREG